MSTKQDVPERVVELNMLGKGSRRGQNNGSVVDLSINA